MFAVNTYVVNRNLGECYGVEAGFVLRIASCSRIYTEVVKAPPSCSKVRVPSLSGARSESRPTLRICLDVTRVENTRFERVREVSHSLM